MQILLVAFVVSVVVCQQNLVDQQHQDLLAKQIEYYPNVTQQPHTFFNNTLLFDIKQHNFDDLVINKTWLIMFYADWCPHCKHFMPIFSQMASNYSQNIDQHYFHQINTNYNLSIKYTQQLPNKLSQLRLGIVECEKQRYLCSRIDIHGYPSLILFQNNSFYKFEGRRIEPNILEFLDSGYHNITAQNIPNEPSTFKIILNMFNSTTFLILLVFLIFLVFICLVDYCITDEAIVYDINKKQK